LLLYPVLFEPLLRVREQSLGWSFGFALLTLFIAICAWLIVKNRGVTAAGPVIQTATEAPGLKPILAWIGLSFVPSGLLVAVTAHLSTDVAAAPFLWVIPLALFLLTFVLIFKEKPVISVAGLSPFLPILAGGLLLTSSWSLYFFLAILIHCALFFVATLICHGRLYALRPKAEHLTAFYLWMSFGGVLGGFLPDCWHPCCLAGCLNIPFWSQPRFSLCRA
jgi:hypothetical protein